VKTVAVQFHDIHVERVSPVMQRRRSATSGISTCPDLTHKSFDKELPFGAIEDEVLAHFIRNARADCVAVPKHKLLTCDACSSQLHLDSIRAVADIITEAVVKVVHRVRTRSGWGCDLWWKEGEDPIQDPENSLRTWNDALLAWSKQFEHVNKRSSVEASLWPHRPEDVEDRDRLGSPCDRLWSAVRDSDYDMVKDVLSDPSQAARLLQIRRRFKVKYNPKILSGPVLTLAIMNYDYASANAKIEDEKDLNKRIVHLLLDRKANVDATYDLFPAGAQHAHVTSPLCFIAMRKASLDVFRDHGADLLRRSKVNYHEHNDILREAAWAKNEEIAQCLLGWMEQDEKLSYLATSASRGWHSDHPPLSRESCARRTTALGRAIDVRMNCVERLISHAQKWTRETLEFDITQILPTMHPRIFTQLLDCKFDLWSKLCFLMWIPEATAQKMHRTLLEQMWQTLQRHDKVMANGELCKEWTEEIKQLSGEQHVRAKRLIALLIHHAPKAATILLDSFFLQEPTVERPNRNPVAMQAVIDRYTEMNTVSAHDGTWTFNGKNMQGCQPWQSALVSCSTLFDALDSWVLAVQSTTCCRRLRFLWSRVSRWLVLHDMHSVLHVLQLCAQCRASCWGFLRGYSTASDIKVSRFCQIRVVHFKGMLDIRMFRAMTQMPVQEQVDLLQACTTLRAVVCYTYGKWTWFSTILFLENVVQMLTLVLVCVRDADLHELAVYWLLFSAPAIAQVIFDVVMFVLFVMSALRSLSDELRITKSMSRRAFVDPLHHAAGVYLISCGCWEEKEGPRPEAWTWCLVLALLIKLFRILDHLSRESKMGELLIPMTDALMDPKMISMLILLILCWIISVAVLQAVQGLFGQDTLPHTLLKTWVNLIVGEPVMLDVEHFDSPWYDSALIVVFHFVFSVAFLNMLLATTIDTYNKKSVSLKGRLMLSKKSVCMHWLTQRECMLDSYRYLFDSTPHRAKFWAFVAVVTTVAILLVVEALSVWMSAMTPAWLPAMIVTTVLLGCRVRFMLQSALVPEGSNSSVDGACGGAGKQFDEPPFLWVCTPERFDKSWVEESDDNNAAGTMESRMGTLQQSMDFLKEREGTMESRMESLHEDIVFLKELLQRRLPPDPPDLT